MKALMVLVAVLVAVIANEDEHGYVSMVRQNYEMKVNNHLRRQVTLELMASYLYQAYGSFFDRADIALPGVKKFFESSSKEERDHADGLVEYINKRGGNMQFEDVKLIDACNTLSKEMKKEDLQSARQESCVSTTSGLHSTSVKTSASMPFGFAIFGYHRYYFRFTEIPAVQPTIYRLLLLRQSNIPLPVQTQHQF